MIETIQQRRLGGRKDSVVASVNAQRMKPAYDFSYDKNPFRLGLSNSSPAVGFRRIIGGLQLQPPCVDVCGSDHDVYHQRPFHIG